MGDLAYQTKAKWPANRWQHTAGEYAQHSWRKLQAKRAFGLSKQRALLEMLEWAHEHGKS